MTLKLYVFVKVFLIYHYIFQSMQLKTLACLHTISRRFDASLLMPIGREVTNRLTPLTGHRKRLVRRAAADAKNAWYEDDVYVCFIHNLNYLFSGQ